MSLYGMMRTGVSGMFAQANRLSVVADNIANSGTTGYKRSQTQFSSLVLPSTSGAYNSGGVTTAVQQTISTQGSLQYTTSGSDLAISGEGFFVVQNGSGQPFLTRAGSFVPDSQGRLVNAAGMQLMGYSFANGVPAGTANGYAGLEPVTISQTELEATASTSGILSTNLPADAAIVAPADLPSANAATATYSAKTSVVTYDSLGREVILDVYYSKTAADEWEVTVYNQADAASGGTSSFPYTSAALANETLNFDPTTGDLTGGSSQQVSVAVPGGATVDIDISSTTQLATDFIVQEAEVNGNPPSGITGIEISNDGTVYAQYEDGSFRALWRIPLANVQSPDNLQAVSGNLYTESADSGDVRIGFANQGGMGEMIAGALENSNVDIAQELTDMIESQRSYSANSKVFQTGSELMDLLVNLKR